MASLVANFHSTSSLSGRVTAATPVCSALPRKTGQPILLGWSVARERPGLQVWTINGVNISNPSPQRIHRGVIGMAASFHGIVSSRRANRTRRTEQAVTEDAEERPLSTGGLRSDGALAHDQLAAHAH